MRTKKFSFKWNKKWVNILAAISRFVSKSYSFSRNECHCLRSYQGKISESSCNTACSGNFNEKCGSITGISVYGQISLFVLDFYLFIKFVSKISL